MSGGGRTTSTTVSQNYSPEEAAKRAQVMDEARRIYEATAGTISSSPYPGPRPLPFSTETLQAQDYARLYALGPALAQANNINAAVQFGLGDVLYPSSNPALQEAINAAIRPVYQEFTDPGGVLSQIRSGAVEAGQFGSSRQGVAEGVAAGRYANAIADIAARMAADAYNKGLDTFSRTLAFAPQAIQAGLMPAEILQAVGAQREMKGAEEEQYRSEADLWRLNAPWMPLQNYAGIVFGGATPTTTTQTRGPGTNMLQPIGTIASLLLRLPIFGG